MKLQSIQKLHTGRNIQVSMGQDSGKIRGTESHKRPVNIPSSPAHIYTRQTHIQIQMSTNQSVAQRLCHFKDMLKQAECAVKVVPCMAFSHKHVSNVLAKTDSCEKPGTSCTANTHPNQKCTTNTLGHSRQSFEKLDGAKGGCRSRPLQTEVSPR